MKKIFFPFLIFISTLSFSQEINIEKIKKSISRIESEIGIKTDSLKILTDELKYLESLEFISEIQNKEGIFPINTIVKVKGKVRKENNLFSETVIDVYPKDSIELIDYELGYWIIKKGNLVGYLSELFVEETKTISLAKEVTISQKEKEIKIVELTKIELEEKELYAYFNECSYTQDEIDEFTGKGRKVTNYYSIDELNIYGIRTLDIRLRRNGNSKYLEVRVSSDLGCASPYPTDKSFVKIKLENGDIITIHHTWDIDCGHFNLIGNLTENDILRLKKSPIKTIRLQGTKYYEDYDKIYFKRFFINKLDCIK